MTPQPTAPLVEANPEKLGGRPVFFGTHVPIDVVLALIDSDEASARLRGKYPS